MCAPLRGQALFKTLTWLFVHMTDLIICTYRRGNIQETNRAIFYNTSFFKLFGIVSISRKNIYGEILGEYKVILVHNNHREI